MQKFNGRLLIIGCGSVSQCAIPLVLKLTGIPPKNITIMDYQDNRPRVHEALRRGVRYVQKKVTSGPLNLAAGVGQRPKNPMTSVLRQDEKTPTFGGDLTAGVKTACSQITLGYQIKNPPDFEIQWVFGSPVYTPSNLILVLPHNLLDRSRFK